MIDPAVITAKSGLARILTSIASKLETGTTKEIQSLKMLADFKFSQIERTHRFFFDLLITLQRAAERAKFTLETSSNLRKSWKVFLSEADTARWSRESTSEERREEYEEARQYASNEIIERGILKSIPDPVARAFQVFMKAYCEYFLTEHRYSHDLKRVIEKLSDSLHRFRGRIPLLKKPDPSTKKDFETLLTELNLDFEDSREHLRTRWAKVAEAYHGFNLVLRGYGLASLPPRHRDSSRP